MMCFRDSEKHLRKIYIEFFFSSFFTLLALSLHRSLSFCQYINVRYCFFAPIRPPTHYYRAIKYAFLNHTENREKEFYPLIEMVNQRIYRMREREREEE
jgi:hypothetical protein